MTIMYTLSVIRHKLDFYNGQRTPKLICTIKHKKYSFVQQMYQSLLSIGKLEGGDRVISKAGNLLLEDFKLCNSCCINKQTNNKPYCPLCLVNKIPTATAYRKYYKW